MNESKIEKLVWDAAFLTKEQKEKLMRMIPGLTPEKLEKLEQFFKNAQSDLTDMVREQNEKRKQLISKNG